MIISHYLNFSGIISTVSVSPKEIREHCRPMLRRKGFRFSRLDGLIEDERRRSLEVAKAFAQPGGQSRFMYSLRDAPKTLSDGVRRAIDAKSALPQGQNGAAQASQLALLANIQRELIAHGVYSEFGRPATSGILLLSRSLGGIPTHFVLSEPHANTSIFCGRMTISPDGSRHMAIFVSGAAARMMEIMDIWLHTPQTNPDEMLERRLIRADRGSLERFVCGRGKVSPEETPFLIALNVISMRSCVARLRSLAETSSSPSEFLLLALNAQLDSVVAHETAHLEERKANGSVKLPKETREILAYLLEAVHSRADDAFQSLLHRSFDFHRLMPGLEADIRGKGLESFLEDSAYLSRWAKETLDGQFVAISGKTHEELIDTLAIRAVQSSDFMGQEQIPLIERAMYNPSNHFRR